MRMTQQPCEILSVQKCLTTLNGSGPQIIDNLGLCSAFAVPRSLHQRLILFLWDARTVPKTHRFEYWTGVKSHLSQRSSTVGSSLSVHRIFINHVNCKVDTTTWKNLNHTVSPHDITTRHYSSSLGITTRHYTSLLGITARHSAPRLITRHRLVASRNAARYLTTQLTTWQDS